MPMLICPTLARNLPTSIVIRSVRTKKIIIADEKKCCYINQSTLCYFRLPAPFVSFGAANFAVISALRELDRLGVAVRRRIARGRKFAGNAPAEDGAIKSKAKRAKPASGTDGRTNFAGRADPRTEEFL